MKVFYTGVDNGDGSVSVAFFDSQMCIEVMEEFDPEAYRGEGGFYFEADNIVGLDIHTIEDVIMQLDSWGVMDRETIEKWIKDYAE